jgi:ATP/maltotriose-dependent transcriptional regulator MalT
MAYYRPKGSFGAQPIHIPRMQPAGAPLEDMHFDDCLECGAEASLFVDDYELCDDPQIMSAVRSYSVRTQERLSAGLLSRGERTSFSLARLEGGVDAAIRQWWMG